MLGFKVEARLSRTQKKQVDRWIAAQNGIYNSKVEEAEYFYRFSKFALSLAGMSPKTDAAYSHLVSYWMRAVPSQILRNGASRYYEAKQRFFSGLAKLPRKKKGLRRSCRVTNELFTFEQVKKGESVKGRVSLKRIGKIHFGLEQEIVPPKMLTLSRTSGKYFLSFCYDDGKKIKKQSEVYEELKSQGYQKLEFLGVDRGVIVQAACSDGTLFEFTQAQKERLVQKERQKKKFQRKLARQQKGSRNRKKTILKVSKISAKIANIRRNFNHHTSKAIAESDAQVIVFENLKLKNMTRSASGTQEEPGTQVKAKSGLNRAILSCNLGQQLDFVKYKAIRSGKLVLKVKPHGSSIECQKCTHSDPNNRLTQAEFRCLRCGHTENADIHASKVIAQRGLHDFLSGKVEFLDESKKKVKTARRKREYACGEDVRRTGQSAKFATSVKQEPGSSKPPATAA
jgi:putative transposase